MIIEKNRLVYSIEEDTKNMLTIVEDQDGWKTLAIGWEYSHWHIIGERAGLAEAGELNIKGRLKTSIEQYIHVYRQLFKKPQSIHRLFESFDIVATLQFESTDGEWTKKRKRELLAEYDFQEVAPNAYQKKLANRHYRLFEKNYCSFTYLPKTAIKVEKPILTEEQITLF